MASEFQQEEEKEDPIGEIRRKRDVPGTGIDCRNIDTSKQSGISSTACQPSVLVASTHTIPAPETSQRPYP